MAWASPSSVVSRTVAITTSRPGAAGGFVFEHGIPSGFEYLLAAAGDALRKLALVHADGEESRTGQHGREEAVDDPRAVRIDPGVGSDVALRRSAAAAAPDGYR